MLNISTTKIYEWIGRIVFWGGLVFYVLYSAYSLGIRDGLSDGYIIGWFDGRLGLKPINPNLPPDIRQEEQGLAPKRQRQVSPKIEIEVNKKENGRYVLI